MDKKNMRRMMIWIWFLAAVWLAAGGDCSLEIAWKVTLTFPSILAAAPL